MLRVLVPIKQVAALDEDFEIAVGATDVDPGFLERDLNEWDAFALEAAILIREAGRDGQVEVVAVTVGDEETEEALLACLAKGADRAIRVWDEGLPADDPLAVATVLAGVARREAPELLLCGVQSSDGASGATGAALAGLLGLPRTAVVRALDFDAGAHRLSVDRELEGGLIEEVVLPTPALVTVQTGTNEPRYATLRAIKQAANKPLERLAVGDMGLSLDELQRARGCRVISLAPPDLGGRRAEMLGDDPAIVADRIMEIVTDCIGNPKGAPA